MGKIPESILKNKAFAIKKRKRKIQPYCTEAASLHCGDIKKGCDIFGLSNGSFSSVDLVDWVLCATGPADVVLATWTAAAGNLTRAGEFLKNGKIRTLRFLIDGSFVSRKPEYSYEMVKLFGNDCIRTVGIHAKFCLIKNDEWNVVINTSMNLTENKRVEDYRITDDADMMEYMLMMVDDIWDDEPAGDLFNQAAYSKNEKQGMLDYSNLSREDLGL